jgi:hypothetical protein
MNRRNLRRVISVLGVAAALVTSACGPAAQATDGIDPHWVETIRQIRAHNPSENELRILADYHVSDVELQEVKDEAEECAFQRWRVHRFDDGEIGWMHYSEVPGATEQDFDEAFDYCETSTGFATIGWLHSEMRSNPRGLTWAQMIRECFEEHGEPAGGGLSEELFDELVNATPGFIAYTDAGRKCAFDPLGEQNLTMAQVEMMEENRVIINWAINEDGETIVTVIE